MRLIDADVLKADYGMADDCKNCKTGWRSCQGDNTYTKMNFCGWLDDAPTVDAIPVVRKPVEGYEGYYEVDQFGRVYALDRIVHVSDNGREYDKPLKGGQMKQHMHSKGYKIVVLTKTENQKLCMYIV